jgi:integrase
MARWKDTRDYIYITDADADKIQAHIGRKWALALRMLRLYGMRVTELLSLTPANFRNGEMVIQRLKKGRLTRQHIASEIREELMALIDQRAPNARLFPYTRMGMYEALQDAGRRANVDLRVCHPHAFRHAAGRRWARMGTIAEVAAMMGHTSITNTMMYSRLECDTRLSKKFLE